MHVSTHRTHAHSTPPDSLAHHTLALFASWRDRRRDYVASVAAAVAGRSVDDAWVARVLPMLRACMQLVLIKNAETTPLYQTQSSELAAELDVRNAVAECLDLIEQRRAGAGVRGAQDAPYDGKQAQANDVERASADLHTTKTTLLTHLLTHLPVLLPAHPSLTTYISLRLPPLLVDPDPDVRALAEAVVGGVGRWWSGSGGGGGSGAGAGGASVGHQAPGDPHGIVPLSHHNNNHHGHTWPHPTPLSHIPPAAAAAAAAPYATYPFISPASQHMHMHGLSSSDLFGSGLLGHGHAPSHTGSGPPSGNHTGGGHTTQLLPDDATWVVPPSTLGLASLNTRDRSGSGTALAVSHTTSMLDLSTRNLPSLDTTPSLQTIPALPGPHHSLTFSLTTPTPTDTSFKFPPFQPQQQPQPPQQHQHQQQPRYALVPITIAAPAPAPAPQPARSPPPPAHVIYYTTFQTTPSTPPAVFVLPLSTFPLSAVRPIHTFPPSGSLTPIPLFPTSESPHIPRSVSTPASLASLASVASSPFSFPAPVPVQDGSAHVLTSRSRSRTSGTILALHQSPLTTPPAPRSPAPAPPSLPAPFPPDHHPVVIDDVDVAPPVPPPRHRRAVPPGSGHSPSSTSSGGSAFAPPPKRRRDHDTGRRCEACGTDESPEWRNGEGGRKTLCNACGLRYARKLKQEGKLKRRGIRKKRGGGGGGSGAGAGRKRAAQADQVDVDAELEQEQDQLTPAANANPAHVDGEDQQLVVQASNDTTSPPSPPPRHRSPRARPRSMSLDSVRSPPTTGAALLQGSMSIARTLSVGGMLGLTGLHDAGTYEGQVHDGSRQDENTAGSPPHQRKPPPPATYAEFLPLLSSSPTFPTRSHERPPALFVNTAAGSGGMVAAASPTFEEFQVLARAGEAAGARRWVIEEDEEVDVVEEAPMEGWEEEDEHEEREKPRWGGGKGRKVDLVEGGFLTRSMLGLLGGEGEEWDGGEFEVEEDGSEGVGVAGPSSGQWCV
ncbi:hypothetical protein M427DRAFT_69263 [Gonapodya prolifera JEL478]|uniref:GATA-type domain-containing protein n=1 Tax=Gonapodya prolifera (strain JEL478) TaxID=1344416 RepID=A0A139AHI9_GONPJ|nr:hypothetical protein M427DRAFT_69263 [Gonapodya prolifera JEL478]|eukprot:KXS16291.1 hypothetical protein M427DRAFT_69263 [Gonapodya prolifera JEL478]